MANRYVRDKRNRLPAPVHRINVSGEHVTRNFVLAVLFLLIGVGAIVYGVKSYISGSRGMQEIKAAPQEASCAADFTLMYEVGQAPDLSPNAEQKAVRSCFADASVEIYQALSPDVEYGDTANLCTLNKNPNREISVAPALYQALEKVEASGSRYLYYGPLSWQYRDLFSCGSDEEAGQADPAKNEELAAYFARTAAFAADGESISLSLLGNDRVILNVSEEYLDFARANDQAVFLDFGRLKNAFMIDYLADSLAEKGFIYGYFTGHGLVRNPLPQSFDMVVYRRLDADIYPAARMTYRGGRSIVWMHDYAVNNTEEHDSYYTYRNGDTVCDYINTDTGLSHAAESDLLCFSDTRDCAGILLEALPVYTAESIDRAALERLKEKGIDSVSGEGEELFCTDDSVSFSELYDKGQVSFTITSR